MVAGSYTKEANSPVAVERLWKAVILDIATLIPKIMPDHIASIDIIEGDGGVGTIKQFNFGPALITEVKYIKDRVEELDNVNHVFKYTLFEGGLVGVKLKPCLYELKLEATGSDGGSLVKLKVEYDTLDETPLTEEEQEKITKGFMGIMKGAEGYLLANPTAYA